MYFNGNLSWGYQSMDIVIESAPELAGSLFLPMLIQCYEQDLVLLLDYV